VEKIPRIINKSGGKVKDALLENINTIAIIGGTGKEGKGLAVRWAQAGYKIIIGSRNTEKAENAANEILSFIDGKGVVVGMENPAAAQEADLAVLTVPFAAHTSMLESLKPFLIGKVLIDVTVPLVPPKVSKVQMPPAGSAAQEAQQILGEEVSVVAAFQNISYENLLEGGDVDCDILVCGITKQAREVVLALVKEAGLIGWDAGPIENSVVVEGMTSILIGINKKYGVTSSGIRITGVN
jgi:NADPH-dependent F420 reductase